MYFFMKESYPLFLCSHGNQWMIVHNDLAVSVVKFFVGHTDIVLIDRTIAKKLT